MRRFSQRSHLVTLSEINITPLLDLAFVLLIIFVIISPSIRSASEQGMNLNLPSGGGPDGKINPGDVHTVEISTQGAYMLDGVAMSLNQVETALVNVSKKNPNMIVFIRMDKRGYNEHTTAVIDRCLRNGITRFSWRTEAKSK